VSHLSPFCAKADVRGHGELMSQAPWLGTGPGAAGPGHECKMLESLRLAGEPGFEPRQTESESVVLPLHHSP
jgi:hypothetical protein